MHAFRGKILRNLRLFGAQSRISKICFGASKSRNIRNLFPLKSSGIILRISGLFGDQSRISGLFGDQSRISGLFGDQSRISKICFGASKSRNTRNLFPLKSSGKILRISGLFGDRTCISKICFGASKSPNIRNLFHLKIKAVRKEQD